MQRQFYPSQIFSMGGLLLVGLLLYIRTAHCGGGGGDPDPIVYMNAFDDMEAFKTCSHRGVPGGRTASPALGSLKPPSPEQVAFREFLGKSQGLCHRPQYEFTQGLNPSEYTGFGSRITVMGATMAAALAKNQTYTISGEWLWTDPSVCPQRDHTCYFQPVSPCEKGNVADSFVDRQEKPWVPWDSPQLDRWGLSPFQLGAELTYYMLQPNSNLVGDIRAAQEILQWDKLPRPVLAVHVRHGKKTWEGKYYSNDDFMQAVKTMKDRHGYRSLFLLTDDLETSRYFETNATAAGFHSVVSLDNPRFVQHGWKESEKNLRDAAQRVKSGESNGCNEAISTLLNIYLAATADGFVGVYNSNLSRTIAKMMVAMNGGKMPPNVSLDVFFTMKDKGTCWHDFMCDKRKTKVLVETDSGVYPMTTSLVN